MFLRDSNGELTHSQAPQKREVIAETSKRSEKTFQEIAKEIGLKIPKERIEELKGEGKLKELFTMDEKGNVLLREGEAKDKVLELLASSVRTPDANLITALFAENQTTQDERKTNRVFFNIEQIVNQAVDAAGRDEFSKLKHHKGKVAVMTGVGVAAAGAVTTLRYFTGGAARIAGSLSGFVSGGYSGYARGWMRDRMAPIFERFSKGDSEKLQNIRKEKMYELLTDDNILLAIEQGMRKSVLEYFNEGGETIEDFKDNAQRFIERNYREVGSDQKETMANAMALLIDVSKQNEAMISALSGKEERSVYEKIHKKLGTKGSAAVIGAAMSGIGSIVGAEAAGAASGVFMGGALEKWWKNKDLRERSEKAVQEVRSFSTKPVDQLTIQEIERVMGNLQAGFLEKDQFAKKEAERLLIEKTLHNEKQLVEKGGIEKERQRLTEEFDHERRWHKRAAYALGIGAGVLLGGTGRLFAEEFGPKEVEAASAPSVTTAPEHSLPEVPAHALGLDSPGKVDAKLLESYHTIGTKANPEDLESVLHASASQKIGGNVDTFTQALRRAIEKVPDATQDEFIKKALGDKAGEITDATRDALIKRAVEFLSISNVEVGGKLVDVENLVYDGNVLIVREDGSWDMIQSEGVKAPKIVSEEQLREWAGKGAVPEAKPVEEAPKVPPPPTKEEPPLEEAIEQAPNPLDEDARWSSSGSYYTTVIVQEDVPTLPDGVALGAVVETNIELKEGEELPFPPPPGGKVPDYVHIYYQKEYAEDVDFIKEKSVSQNLETALEASKVITRNVDSVAKGLGITPGEYLKFSNEIEKAVGERITYNVPLQEFNPAPISQFYEKAGGNLDLYKDSDGSYNLDQLVIANNLEGPSKRIAEALSITKAVEELSQEQKLGLAQIIVNPSNREALTSALGIDPRQAEHIQASYRDHKLLLEGGLQKARNVVIDFGRDEIRIRRAIFEFPKREVGIGEHLEEVVGKYIKT